MLLTVVNSIFEVKEKMKKKILALILAVVMCVTSLSVAVFAVNIEKVPSTIPGTDIAYNRVENITVKIPGTDFTFELEGVSDTVGLTYEEGIPVYRFAFYEAGGNVKLNTSGAYGYESFWVYEEYDKSDYFWTSSADGTLFDKGYNVEFGLPLDMQDSSDPSFRRFETYINENNCCSLYDLSSYNGDDVIIAKVEFTDGNGGNYKDLWFPYDLMSYEQTEDEKYRTYFLPAEIEKIDISEIAVTDDEEIIENPQYSITKGANSVWDSSSNEDLTITADGDFSKFTGVKVDDKKLDTANYDAKAGSTVVTLKSSYLKTLNSGKHTVTFVYTDGEVSTQIEIKGAKAPSNSQNVEIPNTDSEFSNMTAVYVLIAIMSAFGVAVIHRKKHFVK